MESSLYLHLLGATEQERKRCALEHTIQHLSFLTFNKSIGKMTAFCHTDQYKIIQSNIQEIEFWVADIMVPLRLDGERLQG